MTFDTTNPDLGPRLDADDFTLFDVPPRFAQDRARLDARWKALQSQVHPDRFASQGAAERHRAMDWAIRVNEAYQRLKDPLKRAAYLCELHGESPAAQSNTAMPAAFLMQQMAWREALDEARGAAAIEALGAQVDARREGVLRELAAAIDERADWPGAAALVRALMFISRFAGGLEQRLDAAG